MQLQALIWWQNFSPFSLCIYIAARFVRRYAEQFIGNLCSPFPGLPWRGLSSMPAKFQAGPSVPYLVRA